MSPQGGDKVLLFGSSGVVMLAISPDFREWGKYVLLK